MRDPIGFAYTNQGTFGLEQTQNAFLAGKPIEQSSVIDQLEGKQTGGDNVYTTLDPAAQTVALSRRSAPTTPVQSSRWCPSTGAITRPRLRDPTYNPNLITTASYHDAMVSSKSGASSLTRAPQAEDAPGSAIKGRHGDRGDRQRQVHPGLVLSGNSPADFEGIPLNNDGNTSYGEITSPRRSPLGQHGLSPRSRSTSAARCSRSTCTASATTGDPPIDLPSDELTTSGVRDQTCDSRVVPPTSETSMCRLLGSARVSCYVTPLQMAMVASAVANDGRLMRPHIVDTDRNADGVDRVTRGRRSSTAR